MLYALPKTPCSRNDLGVQVVYSDSTSQGTYTYIGETFQRVFFWVRGLWNWKFEPNNDTFFDSNVDFVATGGDWATFKALNES